MTYKLTDNTISQIAKLLQVAILTGTDIVDNLRTIRLVTDDNGDLEPSPEFLEQFEENLDKMVASIAIQHTQDDGEVN
jgi:hypothetical protein